MRILVASTLSLLAGCTLYFGGDGDDAEPPCAYPAEDRPLIAEVVRLVNPETLACQTFNVGTPCDDRCGPCAETAGAPQELPAWGACASDCIGLSEAACRNDISCRIARRADLYYGGADGTPATGDDFLGCYPLSTERVTPGQSCDGHDAYACSTDPACTAVYEAPYGVPCGNFKTPEQCPGAQFEKCIPEPSTDPGQCTVPVACDALPPACPANEVPGVLGSCWSGICIPERYCGLSAD